MLKRDFCGQAVSALALGAANFGSTCSQEQAFEFMDAYAALGGNFIDTARVYTEGNSEKIVGRWIEARHNRDQIFVSTKGAHPNLQTMTVSRLSRAEIFSDMAKSLDALRMDHVDIYWLHRDETSRPVGDILETMQALKEAGHTRLIGVSNWTPARILEANDYARTHGLTAFCANQPQFSLANPLRLPDPTLLKVDEVTWRMHRDTQLICVPYTSQANGFFAKLDALGEDALPPALKRQYLSSENLDIYARLKALSAQTGHSISALSLAYLTSQPFPVFPLVGVSRRAHVEAMKEASEVTLTREQCDYLRAF